MPLTEAQEETLLNDITVIHATEFAEELAAVDDQAVAEAYNLPASPDFWVYRTSVPKSEIVGAVSSTGTTFTWAGNGFITRAVGELMAWQELFSGDPPSVNASLPQVRTAFTDIFSGTGNAATNRTHLAAVARRLATRAEQLFATGTGSTAAPGTLTFEGALSYLDIAAVFGRA